MPTTPQQPNQPPIVISEEAFKAAGLELRERGDQGKWVQLAIDQATSKLMEEINLLQLDKKQWEVPTVEYDRQQAENTKLREEVSRLESASHHMMACRALLHTDNNDVLFSSIQELQSQLTQAQGEVARINGLWKCEHCGSDRIYSGPPDCPRCGAPNCCEPCCLHQQQLTQAREEIECLKENFAKAQNACTFLENKSRQLSQWQECAREMYSTIKLIRTEHNNTMYEVSDIGYSEGLCLKPSLKDSVDKALSLYTQLTQEKDKP